MSDETTLGTFAKRQLKREWAIAAFGADDALRKLEQGVKRSLHELEAGQVPSLDLSRELHRFEDWQSRLSLLKRINEVLEADKYA